MTKKIVFLSFIIFLVQCSPTEQKANIGAQVIKLNAFYDKIFEAEVMRSPEYQTRLGRKTNMDKWDDYSRAHHDLEIIFAQNILNTLKDSFSIKNLNDADQLNYILFQKRYENIVNAAPYYKYKFWVNQMHGIQSEIPAFLINNHKIAKLGEAEAYIKRLEGVSTVLEQVKQNLEKSAQEGIIVPQFVFEHVINDCQNIIKGQPLTSNGTNTLYADFNSKIALLNLKEKDKKALNENLIKGLADFGASYQNFIDFLKELEKKAPTKDGLWQYPGGEAYYKYALSQHTTTDLTPEEIHQIGLSEVKRIHNEMTLIKEKVGFKGRLQDFFKFMKEDNQFYYADTKEGRKAYLKKASVLIDNMKQKLPDLFTIFPKADIKVKAVESFREKSAGKAFYEEPAPDGSRPGTFYVNTYSMQSIPSYQMEALAYHEGIPGHHMQISLAQENDKLPKFRKFGTNYNAYVEGWALYSEAFPKDYGFYNNPYNDFGRLAMELWRACRLVVDTGIHSKQWDRKKGIMYYSDNTPNDMGECIKMVERHIVMPGQATSYKIGMMKIVKLRIMAQNELGKKFDIRQFHDKILSSGPIPLDILEDNINKWIQKLK